MCGIAGVVCAKGSAPADRERLEAMTSVLAHRGPDDSGAWMALDGSCALGHRRLSIIDLSPGGHQPKTRADGSLVLVFNGEMYNYREVRERLVGLGAVFESASDTEVLMAAYQQWGTACLDRVQGQFAFALYDASKRQVFLARDRAGEKPLFYADHGDRLAFASELKSLLASGEARREIDPNALDFYLAYGYVPGDKCILRGVRKLPPGHAMVWDQESGAARVWRYWDLPTPSREDEVDEQGLCDELEGLLEAAVARQMVADVPVGILLSGGIDSSLVTAMAARTSSRPVRTFTISFPGHGGYDESGHARAVAEHFGTDHVELAAEPASVDLLPQLARQYDEPLADSSMVPTFLVSRLIRREATVALGGDGGDELFGGYHHYRWIFAQNRYQRIVPRPIRVATGALARTLLPVGVRGRNYLTGATDGIARSMAHVNLFFDAPSRRRLTGGLLGGGAPETFKGSMLDGRERTVIQKATAIDFRTYLPDDILAKVDRASMLTSLEVRAPWLDPAVIEFAFGRVPDRFRATGSELKILPRRLARRLLPPTVDLDRKQGFAIPLSQWFRGEWGRFIEEVLLDRRDAIFAADAVEGLLRGQKRGLANTQRLFALTMFELWRREYRITL